ncbi:MAG TPA: type II secretion system protein [Patescibacteria group bacterium]|nr:type II secretion system protein [Patescibacteria group bacterium]
MESNLLTDVYFFEFAASWDLDKVKKSVFNLIRVMINLSKLFKSFHSSPISLQSGFTLIELLVVIGILGVLAAALVATIDPFEQLKKANDANVKNTAVEFIDANIRYYTTHSHMPWAPGGCNAGNDPSSLSLYPDLTTCMSSLVADGEVKTAFTTVTGVLSSIIINGTDTDITACFLPQSKAQRSDPNTKFDRNGVEIANPSSTCGPTSTACYWCSQ